MRFGDQHWADQLKKAAQDFKFRATLKPRMNNAIKDWHAAQPDSKPDTVIVHHDGEDTTGLGPPLSIHYRWNDERETDPTD